MIDGHHGTEITSSSFFTNHGSGLAITMGIWRGLRVAFVLGSLFMILLIIVYWDDVGGFNLYPLQDPKHESLHSSFSHSTARPSLFPTTSTVQAGSFISNPPNAALTTKLISEKSRETAEELIDEKGERNGKTREDEEQTSSADDREQEARKQRIMGVCSGQDGVEFPGRTRAFEQVPNRELDHLIVDDKHRIIYCYVPKVRASFVFVCVLV